MKKLLFLAVLFFTVSCSEPIRITGKPDETSATSGTLGSVKAENQLPPQTRDTARADTSKRRN